jgi:hypothetical protein
MSTASADLFTPVAGDPPTDVAAGLERLAKSRPLWPMRAGTWSGIVATVMAFAERWDGQARACGWSTLSLYGLHPAAPMARLDAIGAAWLLASSRHRAIAVDASAILVATSTARLRIYKAPIDPVAVLPWPRPGSSWSSITAAQR